jgi:ligand-binding sensor domain-containing protein
MKQIVCLLGVFVLCCGVFAQLQPIGNWRVHIPYHQAIGVEAGGNIIYAATPYAIFSVDQTDNSLHTYNKLTGLSSTGVSCIALDSATGKLVIAYDNSDIDILKNDVVNNINALKQSSLNGDKRVYDIFCSNGLAYICTGIGILAIDESRNEVKDTYIIGDSGQQVQVNGLAMDKNFFYAATAQGLKVASLNSLNLSDFHNWQTDGTIPGGLNFIRGVIALSDNQPVILKNDSLYINMGSAWNFLYASGNGIHSINKKGNQLIISEGAKSTARIVLINADGSIAQIIQQPSMITLPLDSKIANTDVWIADSTNGLIKYSTGTFTPYVPNSPQSISLGDLQIDNDVLWTSAGTVDVNWVAAGNKNGLFRFGKNNWDNFSAANVAALDSLPDIITLAMEATDQSVWGGSFGGGLLHLNADKSIQVYKQNSPLQSPPTQPGNYNVSGLAFDIQHNLWVANYGAQHQLHVRKADGSWRSFTIPYSLTGNAVSQILIDDQNQKWIISPKGNGLICFNDGNSIDNPGDDRWRIFKTGIGSGNLPDNNVLSIAKDKNGFIWVGTSSGIGIIPCVTEIFSNQSCEAVLPVVQSGGFNGFLFHDEQVQSIAVDGADRKWVGTKNGAWLISSDGEQTIYHFTEDASPLLSNDVRRISINGATGEVFFATARGICSYRSSATEGGSSNNNVLVYPNPVPPDYTGQVAIRGLVNNAIVKITELDGRLVYQTRALGGQAIWNGNDYKGNRVSSGVYLVLVTDDNRKENVATKIVFLH